MRLGYVKLQPGDELEFDWELEYILSQRVTLTEDDINCPIDELEDGAWLARMNQDGVIALNDHNVVAVRRNVYRNGEIIQEGAWDD